MQRWKQVSQSQIQECVKNSKSYTEVLKKLGHENKKKNYKIFKK